MARSMEMPRGTLDMLVLRTLELRPLHGIAVAERIRQVTSGAFAIGPGSLFPALHRLEQEGWIAGVWDTGASGRRRRSYTLTSAGRRQLAAERKYWQRIVVAVSDVLEQE